MDVGQGPIRVDRRYRGPCRALALGDVDIDVLECTGIFHHPGDAAAKGILGERGSKRGCDLCTG